MVGYDPVYISLSDKPHAILSLMDSLPSRREDYARRFNQRRWFPWLLLLVALPFLVLDFVLGYSICVFSLVGLALVVAALFTFVLLRRRRPDRHKQFAPHYSTVREIIYTLRDDLAEKANFLGHLDLTGVEKPEKLRREGRNARGKKVNYYQDEWFKLKLRLYDGNMLRLSLIQNSKIRPGFYKRSRSGKRQKWKEGKQSSVQEIKVKVAVNPALYTIVPTPQARAGTLVGQYTVSAIDTQEGMIVLQAVGPATTIQPADVLGMLRFAYQQLQRREAV